MKAVILLLTIFGIVSAQVYARAELQQVNGSGANGYVTFSQTAPGANVTVHAYVQNITARPDELHGIHVHWWGDMTGVNTGALSVGGHWNPANAPHGCPPNVSRHAGDMGNWQATGGVINETKTLDLLELSGINSIIGRAVIFHNWTDDCVTVNTGNAGSRMATGVIGIANSTVYGGAGEANNTIGGVTVAGCKLQPASGTNVSGMVYFVQTGGSGTTTVMAIVDGITGSHGFHLHWFGDISNPAGLATGPHFNPAGLRHGIPPVVERHLGDMGIISYMANGSSYYHYVNDQISLNGLNNVIGRAVHVHQNSDDCTNPVGSGGARYAQCVIGIFNSTAFVAPTNIPAGVPTTQNGIAICNVAYNASSTSASGSMGSSSSGISTTTAANSGADQISYVVACVVAAIVALFI